MVASKCTLALEGSMTFVFVYCIENLINNKQYIGIAVDYSRRWNDHKSGNASRILYAAFQKYGVENFNFEVIDILPEDEAKELEVLLIKTLRTKAPAGYNITEGGEGTVGCIPSKETRQKMSKSRTGKRNGMYGKSHSTETKEKMCHRAKIRDPKTRIIAGVGLGLSGSTNYNAKPVLVDGQEYGCIKDAALDIGCHPETLRRKFRQYRKTNAWPVGWAKL